MFLKDSKNKTELFEFTAETISLTPSDHEIIVTRNDTALCNSKRDVSGLACSHEEADTRMFVHARYAVIEGARRITLKVNDTDILVIAIAMFPLLQLDGLQELWVDFGSSSNRKLIPVHLIATSLGQERCDALLFLHAFSGCDTVSAFRQKGKKTLYSTWLAVPEVTPVFAKLSNCPGAVTENDMDAVQKFTVKVYDKNSEVTNVNEARLEMFTRKQTL